MSWQNFFAVGWCECAVTLDAGDGSVASTPRYDATRIADRGCTSQATRTNGRPGLRWVTSRLCGEPDIGCRFERVRYSCSRTLSLPSRCAACVRRRGSASLQGVVTGPGTGRVSPPWTAPASGYWPDASNSLAHDSSAAHVGRDPNSLRMDLHGCRWVRHVCPGTRARRFSSRPPRSATLREDQIGADQESP